MGFRFKKSKTIIPGVKVNVGKNSVGLSIGGKLGGISINSKTGVTARASLPGTGISYTENLTSKAKQAYRAEENIAKNAIKIIEDSVKLINTTTNPDVFFKRLELFEEKLNVLCELKDIKFNGQKPKDKLKEFKKEKHFIVNAFIDRCFEETILKIDSLKTVDAKLRNREKFYVELSTYINSMPSKSSSHFKERYNDLLEITQDII